MGSLTDYRLHPVYYRMPAFHLSVFNLVDPIYVRIASLGSLQFPISVMTQADFSSFVASEYLSFGIYYGLIFAIGIYNLFLFLSSKEVVFALYSTYVCAFGIFQMSMNGLAQQYLWPSPSWWSTNSVSVEIPMFLFFMVAFAKEYLGKGGLPRLIWSSLTLIQGVTIGNLIAVFFVPYKIVNQFGADMCFVTVTALLIAGAFGLRARKPAAAYFLAAWTLFLFGLGLFALRNLGLIPSNFVTTYAIQIGSAIEVLLLSMGLGTRLRILREEKLKMEGDLAESRRKFATIEAVARMTQMLAHDVRRPFSLLRMGLGMLSRAEDTVAIRSTVARLAPEIDRALSSVNGMIADVMEVGASPSAMVREAIASSKLVEQAVSDSFRFSAQSNISIKYSLDSQRGVLANVAKVGRVFANILSNAAQAMGNSGLIWISTRDTSDAVEFCIGNAGSFIESGEIASLFDAFYTRGKIGGTGLGLAIAHKVVTAHGGRIWCESSRDDEFPSGKVEFFFTLPFSAEIVETPALDLPTHSSEIASRIRHDFSDGNDSSNDERDLTQLIVDARKTATDPLRILFVDDEYGYRRALSLFVEPVNELAGVVSVVEAINSQEAIDAIHKYRFDLIITDIDMAPDSLDGFDLARAFRANGVKAIVCHHSNRTASTDHTASMEAGADLIIPKPMAKGQLLRLILQAASRT